MPTPPTIVEKIVYGIRMPDGKTFVAQIDDRDTQQSHLRVSGLLVVAVKLRDGLITHESADRVNFEIAALHRSSLERVNAAHHDAPMPYLVSHRVITITDGWATQPTTPS